MLAFHQPLESFYGIMTFLGTNFIQLFLEMFVLL